MSQARLFLHGASGILLAAGLWSCGAHGSFDGRSFVDSEASYELGPLSPAWRRIDLDGHNDLAFRNGGLGAVIQVNASCDPDLDIPLRALTNHLLIGFTERRHRAEDLVDMVSREALRTHVEAKLDGVARELILHVLKKDGCVYDFALVAPPGDRFARAERDYEGMVRGFQVRSPR